MCLLLNNIHLIPDFNKSSCSFTSCLWLWPHFPNSFLHPCSTYRLICPSSFPGQPQWGAAVSATAAAARFEPRETHSPAISSAERRAGRHRTSAAVNFKFAGYVDSSTYFQLVPVIFWRVSVGCVCFYFAFFMEMCF